MGALQLEVARDLGMAMHSKTFLKLSREDRQVRAPGSEDPEFC